jgi:hypothetical protein
MPKIEAPIQPDWAGIIRQAGNDYNEGALTRKMIDEHPEDEALIRQKGGSAYADMLKAEEQRAEERQWALDDTKNKQDFQRELLDAQYKNALNLEGVRNANARSLAEFKAGLGADNPDTNAQRNVASMIEAGYSPQEAWAMYYGGNNPTLNMDMLGKKGQEAADKKIGEYVADEQIAQQQMKTLKPKAENALRRAKESLADGTGLGQFGGWGWTTGKGGQNRANIKNAQAQINTTMRGLLKQMGVGSTELNSAVEAEAYRYMLDPNTPIEQQEQVLKNFEEDYLSGALQRDLAETYGQQKTNIDTSDPRIQEALANGYSLEEIQAYLRK